jgi:hypothetical protein
VSSLNFSGCPQSLKANTRIVSWYRILYLTLFHKHSSIIFMEHTVACHLRLNVLLPRKLVCYITLSLNVTLDYCLRFSLWGDMSQLPQAITEVRSLMFPLYSLPIHCRYKRSSSPIWGGEVSLNNFKQLFPSSGDSDPGPSRRQSNENPN